MWKPNLLNASTTAEVPLVLQAVASFDADSLQAAGKGKKLPTFTMRAYSGGTMKPSGYGHRVVVNLAGVSHDGRVPIFLDHEVSGKGLVGHADVSVDGNISLAGIVSGATDAAKTVVESAKQGFEWQCSIGCEVEKKTFVSEDDTATINGQTFTGPFYHIEKSKLYETSFVPIGADSTTSASIAAKKGVEDMTTETVPTMDDKTRFVALARAADGDADLISQALEGDWTPEKVELESLKATMASGPRTNVAGAAGHADQSQVLEAALLMKSNINCEKDFNERVLDKAESFSQLSMIEMLRCSLRGHIDKDPARLSLKELLQASSGFSTGSMTNAMSGAIDKVAAQAYREAPQTFRPISRKIVVNNFRENTAIRPSHNVDYLKLAPSGEIQSGEFGEATTTVQVATFARMLTIAREYWFNDDTGILADVPRALGRSAARRVSDDFWRAWLGNLEFDQATSFFTTPRGNLITDALDIAGLTAATLAFRTMTTPAGDPSDGQPSVLVVCPELEQTAKALLHSAELSRIATSDNAPSGNPFAENFSLVVEPRLSNSNFSGYSSTAWYLCGSGPDAPGALAYLNGRESPSIESQDTDFSTLGTSYRGYLDFGVALSEYMFAIKSTGAG